jgi:hypothetical protein
MQLDEYISECQTKYLSQLPDDLITAETVLKQHICEKEHVIKLLNFTSGEGDEIVYRIRQQVL